MLVSAIFGLVLLCDLFAGWDRALTFEASLRLEILITKPLAFTVVGCGQRRVLSQDDESSLVA